MTNRENIAYPEHKLLAEIRKQMDDQNLGPKQVAYDIGLSPVYVANMLAGRQKPNEALLKHFGFERVEIYRRRQ
jgi:hypothetical protein